MTADLAKIYQAFDPAPLNAGQQTELYVNLASVRGEHEIGGIARSLAQHMRLSKEPTRQLLTGHRGSGKSTELYRLQRILGEGDKKVFAVFCDIDQALNRNDLDFPDLLLAVVRQLVEQAKSVLGITVEPGYFQDRFLELEEFLGSKVSIEKMELIFGLTKIVGVIKNSPSSRKTIRAMLEPKVDSLLYATNDVIAKVRGVLKAKGFADLALIIDNTDHLARRTGEDAEDYPGERLFLRRFPEVSGLDCHVVYAIPLELAFSPRESELKRLYGRKTPIVGIAKVRARDGTPLEQGIACFRELIQKRVQFAGAQVSEVFASATVRDDLILLTGGQPLELCSLIRECILGGLPVQPDRLAELRRQEHRSYASWLKRSHWGVIEAIRKGQQPIPDDENGPTLRDLVEGRAILHHMNDEDWLAVSPLVGAAPALL